MSEKPGRTLIATSVLRLAACARAQSDSRAAELFDAAAAEIERLSGLLREARNAIDGNGDGADNLIARIDAMLAARKERAR